MPPKLTKERPRIGRPPAGARDGEKVTDYPQLSIRLPAEVKARLQALSVITSRPQWRLIADAIECYLRTRPEAEQNLVGELTRGPKSRIVDARAATRTTRRRGAPRTRTRPGGR